MGTPIDTKLFYGKRLRLNLEVAGPSRISYDEQEEEQTVDKPPPASTATSFAKFSSSESEDNSSDDPDFILRSEDETGSSEESDGDEENDGGEESSDEIPEYDDTPAMSASSWGLVDPSQQKSFQFAASAAVSADAIVPVTPIEIFDRIVNEDVFNLIVEETNRNAEQKLLAKPPTRHARIKKWQSTTVEEIRKFLGLLLWMGLVRYPRISSYWSTSVLFKNSVAPNIMSRNRFQLLLKLWHFSDNESNPGNDRMFKVRGLLDILLKNFKLLKEPGKLITVDESLVPFRGRLLFRQYIPGKSHKYGVKLYKLCDPKGYTYSIIIYSGKGTTSGTIGHSAEVVLKLAGGYLETGRTIHADSFYSSVQLAETLLAKSTHYVGTLRKNRTGIPNDVKNKTLKKGETISLMNVSGVVVTKWADKRDVLMISTCYSGEMTNSGKKNRQGEEKFKPDSVLAYNKAKIGIDKSDQMSSYYSCLRKTIRWYHKVAIELLLGTSVVNTLVLFNSIASVTFGMSALSIEEMRIKLVASLLDLPESSRPTTPFQSPIEETNHQLVETEVKQTGQRKTRRKRLNCKYCYDEIKDRSGAAVAKNKTKKVVTQCKACPGEPFMCSEHFYAVHKITGPS